MADTTITLNDSTTAASKVPDGTEFSALETSTLNGESVDSQLVPRSLIAVRGIEDSVADVSNDVPFPVKSAKGRKFFSLKTVADAVQQISDESNNRLSITIKNVGEVTVWLHNIDEMTAAAPSFPLDPGETLTDDVSKDRWCAICDEGDIEEAESNGALYVIEVFNNAD